MSKLLKQKYILIIILSAVIILTGLIIFIILNNSINKNKEENSEMSQEKNIGDIELSEPDYKYADKSVVVIYPFDKPSYYGDLLAMLKHDVGVLPMGPNNWEDIASYLNDNPVDLLILPNAEYIPAGASQAIDKYLKKGGNLLTLGGPPLSKTLFKSGDEWLTVEEIAQKNEDKFNLLDFAQSSDGKGWTRNTDRPKEGQRKETGYFGSPDGGDSMHVIIDNVGGWDAISKSVKIPEGKNTLCLYAKGGPNTSTLSIELDEKDNSRWYAVFPVTEEWQYVVLSPEDFIYWHDNPSVGRGSAGDKVNFDKVSRFVIGIAFSGITQGANEYWFGSVSLQKSDKLAAEPTLIIDGLSPEWKFYPVTNANKAVAFDNQVFVSDRDYTFPTSENSLFSLSPRPQGTGYKRGKDKRFVPLIEIYDSKNLRSGFLAWMFVEKNIIAGFGTSDPMFYDSNGIAAVADVVRTILDGVMFIEAGSTEYIYIDSETKSLPFGANVKGKTSDGVTIDIELYKNGEIIYQKEYAGTKNNISESYDLSAGKPDKITAILKKDGRITDKISHEIVFWSPKPVDERKYISVGNNEFIRDGKPIRLYGVNYMPSSGIGVNPENWAYFEHYVSKESYDPDVFYKDLLRVKEVGFNSVSLFVYYQTLADTKNILHLIDMCDKLGLVVDLSIRPYADPFNLQDDEVADMIKMLHIAELDNIVAYDIAWERYFGTYEGSYGNPKGRKEYDGEWKEWVINNYGTIENAETEWEYKFLNPTDDMLRNDGKHTKMVAAYRRFVDELVSRKHNYVKDLIREYDPYHLVSARTGAQGGVPLADPGDMGYDYQALANGLDFMSPESYVINSDFNSAEQGIFTNAYSRYCKPDSPVMWKEFGHHIWSGSNFNNTSRYQAVQADYYAKLYDMMIAGHTGAAYCWWFPGGFRTNENSDYGIINPDGSDRLVTGVIRKYREPFLNQPSFGEPDVFFEVDRDKSATGIKGMYENIKDEFLSAVKSGKTAALKDISTGTNTATVADTSISGGGKAGETNPSKFVNGEFRSVYVKLSDGSWKRVNHRGNVKLPAGPVEIKVIMGNSLRTEWLSKSESEIFYVSLVSTAKSNIAFEIPLSKNVKYLETLTQEFKLCDNFDEKIIISFRFGIKDRFPFGSQFEFTVTKG